MADEPGAVLAKAGQLPEVMAQRGADRGAAGGGGRHSVTSEDNTYGVAAVSAPIVAGTDRCVAAVSVSCSPDQLADPARRTDLVTAVRRAAATISELHTDRTGS